MNPKGPRANPDCHHANYPAAWKNREIPWEDKEGWSDATVRVLADSLFQHFIHGIDPLRARDQDAKVRLVFLIKRGRKDYPFPLRIITGDNPRCAATPPLRLNDSRAHSAGSVSSRIRQEGFRPR
jgi:hypothetical protein